jgi:hypothetical protein
MLVDLEKAAKQLPGSNYLIKGRKGTDRSLTADQKHPPLIEALRGTSGNPLYQDNPAMNDRRPGERSGGGA